jgi:calcium/calmodulin-dependent protein kinase I
MAPASEMPDTRPAPVASSPLGAHTLAEDSAPVAMRMPTFAEAVESAPTPKEVFEQVKYVVQLDCEGWAVRRGLFMWDRTPFFLTLDGFILSLFRDRSGSVRHAVNVRDVAVAVNVSEAEMVLPMADKERPFRLTLQSVEDAARWKAALEAAVRSDIEDHFRLGKTIGSGAYGNVVEGFDVQTNERRAIKIIQRGSNLKSREHLSREIQVMMRNISHPGIIRTYQIFDLRRTIYIVMEYVTGGDLFDYIAEQQSLTEGQAVQVMRSILEAVDYLHRNNIVHRDLKPENILCVERTWPLRIKLTDFGFASFIDPELNDDNTMKTPVGTAYFMAPEIITNQGHGPAVDAFACGVILYTMLTGRLPFPGQNTTEYFKNVVNGNARFPVMLWRGISGDAQSLVRGLLNTDPQKRYTAFAALQHQWIWENSESAGTPICRDRSNLHSRRRRLQKARAAVYAIEMALRIKALHESHYGLAKLPEVIDAVGDGTKKFAKGVGDNAKKTADGIEIGVKKTMDGIGTGVKKTKDNFETGMKKTADSFETGVKKTGEGVKKAADSIGEGFKSTAKGFESNVKKTVDGIETGVKKTVDGLETGMKKTGEGVKKAADGFDEGMKKTADGIGQGMKKSMQGIETGVKKSVDGIEVGVKKTVDGIELGMKKTGDNLKKTGENLKKGAEKLNIPLSPRQSSQRSSSAERRRQNASKRARVRTGRPPSGATSMSGSEPLDSLSRGSNKTTVLVAGSTSTANGRVGDNGTGESRSPLANKGLASHVPKLTLLPLETLNVPSIAEGDGQIAAEPSPSEESVTTHRDEVLHDDSSSDFMSACDEQPALSPGWDVVPGPTAPTSSGNFDSGIGGSSTGSPATSAMPSNGGASSASLEEPWSHTLGAVLNQNRRGKPVLPPLQGLSMAFGAECAGTAMNERPGLEDSPTASDLAGKGSVIGANPESKRGANLVTKPVLPQLAGLPLGYGSEGRGSGGTSAGKETDITVGFSSLAAETGHSAAMARKVAHGRQQQKQQVTEEQEEGRQRRDGPDLVVAHEADVGNTRHPEAGLATTAGTVAGEETGRA